jgi:hypothetical protein
MGIPKGHNTFNASAGTTVRCFGSCSEADRGCRCPQARKIGSAGAGKATEGRRPYRAPPTTRSAMKACRGSRSALLKAWLRRTLRCVVRFELRDMGPRTLERDAISAIRARREKCRAPAPVRRTRRFRLSREVRRLLAGRRDAHRVQSVGRRAGPRRERQYGADDKRASTMSHSTVPSC